MRLVLSGFHAEDGKQVKILALQTLDLRLMVGDALDGGEEVLEGGDVGCHG